MGNWYQAFARAGSLLISFFQYFRKFQSFSSSSSTQDLLRSITWMCLANLSSWLIDAKRIFFYMIFIFIGFFFSLNGVSRAIPEIAIRSNIYNLDGFNCAALASNKFVLALIRATEKRKFLPRRLNVTSIFCQDLRIPPYQNLEPTYMYIRRAHRVSRKWSTR